MVLPARLNMQLGALREQQQLREAVSPKKPCTESDSDNHAQAEAVWPNHAQPRDTPSQLEGMGPKILMLSVDDEFRSRCE